MSPSPLPPVAENLAAVRSALADACRRAGRDPASVTLVAVSKTHPPEILRLAYDAGQRIFGENRVQEAKGKIPALPPDSSWHLVGHLQSNKARQALPLFHLIHSLDSLDLARTFQRIASESPAAPPPRLLLQVNVAGESSKSGFSPSELRDAFPALLALDQLHLAGLMTVPPPVENPDDARPHFAALRHLRDTFQQDFGHPLPELSMGMSHDFPAAIAEGATLVRVGSAIFGAR